VPVWDTDAVRLVAYSLTLLPIPLVIVYVIWLRRVALEIPVSLRLILSVIPGFVLYRAVFTLSTFFIYRRYLYFRPSPRFVGFLIVVTGIAIIVLYHIWRHVKLDDFRRRRESEMIPLLGRSESAQSPPQGPGAVHFPNPAMRSK
jgi:hypothetical protein